MAQTFEQSVIRPGTPDKNFKQSRFQNNGRCRTMSGSTIIFPWQRLTLVNRPVIAITTRLYRPGSHLPAVLLIGWRYLFHLQ